MTEEQKAKLKELLGKLDDVDLAKAVETELLQPAVAVVAKTAGEPRSKFGPNPYHITNDEGVELAEWYISAYVQCNARAAEGYTHNRKQNIRYFASAEWLNKFIGKTANEVGRAAALEHERWGMTAEQVAKIKSNGKKNKAAKLAAVVPAAPVAPTIDEVAQATTDEATPAAPVAPKLGKKERKALEAEHETLTNQIIALDSTDPAVAETIELAAKRLAVIEAELG